MEFEIDAPVRKHSLVGNVPINAALDHYRSMVMHRYPSELCDLFRRELPHLNRHAPDGSGATLLFHYLVHGSRDYDVRILDVRNSPEDLVMNMRIWVTYLHGANKAHVMTRSAFREHHASFPAYNYDLAIFDSTHVEGMENAEESFYETFHKTWRLLRVGGTMIFEAVRGDCAHFMMSTLSNLFLFQRNNYAVHMFCPHVLAPLPVQFGVIRKTSDEPLASPLVHVPRPLILAPNPTIAVVTSSYKSIGNNNVFSEQTRFRQLLESVRTVRTHIPNVKVVVAEINPLETDMMIQLRDEGVAELHVFRELIGVPKSAAEGAMLLNLARKYCGGGCGDGPDAPAAFCKLSGRYVLMDNFPGFTPDAIMCKRMRPQEVMTRFFSVPARFFPRFLAGLEEVVRMPEFATHKMDIEHAFGRVFPEMDAASRDYPVIGVGGFYAATCQMVIE